MAEKAIQYDPDDDVGLVNFSFSAYLTLLHQKELFLIEHPDTEVKMGIIETTLDKQGNISEKRVSQELPRITKSKTRWTLVGDSGKILHTINYPSKKPLTMTKEELFEKEIHKEIENLEIYWIEKKIGPTQQLPPRESASSALKPKSDEELGGGKRRKGTRRRKNKSKRFSIKKRV